MAVRLGDEAPNFEPGTQLALVTDCVNSSVVPVASFAGNTLTLGTLLSGATAACSSSGSRDMRVFNFSKDFVLKAGLMLSDIASVGFKVENFDRNNMKKLESNWSQVAETLRLTARLIASFGLSRDTITADSALLPVAYYLHTRRCDDTYLTKPVRRPIPGGRPAHATAITAAPAAAR